ncbi:hypothetical protein Mboo_1177 [Methanoregula boonei 6A8]|jgi:predicted secreted protein|uniref:Uncharacterized protein n=2 Tax=Methanoregula TaxID=395331 RepID=A7I7I4_METB6|nr:hypothetical protein Mboo_1177 [Methanoregula boonei 6A8]
MGLAVNMNPQKPGMVMAGIILFIILLVAGCLGSVQQTPTAVQCTESLLSGQTMSINATQNGAVICAKLNNSIRIELSDPSRMGGYWTMDASPGLQVIDEGIITYYSYLNRTPSQYPITSAHIERYTHAWNVTVIGTGVQTISGYTSFSGNTAPHNKFDLTVVVE